MIFLTICGSMSAADKVGGKADAWVVPAWDFPADSPPPLRARIGELSSPVTSENEEAVRYVTQGLNLMLGYWDIEAYRSFLHASRLDPDCAMAYWGMAMSMLASEGEMASFMDASAHQAFELGGFIDGVEGKELTKEERGMIAALAMFLKDGSGPFVLEMARVSANFPDNRFARLMHVLFIRDGYDATGKARPGQVRALAMIGEYLKSYPDDVQALAILTQMLVHGPDIDDAAVPATKLAKLRPATAYLLHLPGLVAYRQGRYADAVDAFEAAAAFDRDYFSVSGVHPSEVPFFVKNLDHLALTLAEVGRRKEALVAANEAAGIALDPERLGNAGAKEVLYHGTTLPCRVHMRFRDWASATQSLPDWKEVATGRPVPSHVYYEALDAYLKGRAHLANKSVVEARRELLRLDALATGAMQRIPKAVQTHQLPQWNEAINHMNMMVSDLRAGINAIDGDWELARVWWDTMNQRQSSGSGEIVRRWPLTAAELNGYDQLISGSLDGAIDAFTDALEQRPMSGLVAAALAKSLATAGRADDAAAAMKVARETLVTADSAVRQACEIGD